MGLEQSSDWHDDGAEEPAEGRQEEKNIRSAGHRIVNIMMVVAKQGEGEGRVSALVFLFSCISVRMHVCIQTHQVIPAMLPIWATLTPPCHARMKVTALRKAGGGEGHEEGLEGKRVEERAQDPVPMGTLIDKRGCQSRSWHVK